MDIQKLCDKIHAHIVIFQRASEVQSKKKQQSIIYELDELMKAFDKVIALASDVSQSDMSRINKLGLFYDMVRMIIERKMNS
jgi:hypothetical protein